MLMINDPARRISNLPHFCVLPLGRLIALIKHAAIVRRRSPIGCRRCAARISAVVDSLDGSSKKRQRAHRRQHVAGLRHQSGIAHGIMALATRRATAATSQPFRDRAHLCRHSDGRALAFAARAPRARCHAVFSARTSLHCAGKILLRARYRHRQHRTARLRTVLPRVRVCVLRFQQRLRRYTLRGAFAAPLPWLLDGAPITPLSCVRTTARTLAFCSATVQTAPRHFSSVCLKQQMTLGVRLYLRDAAPAQRATYALSAAA